MSGRTIELMMEWHEINQCWVFKQVERKWGFAWSAVFVACVWRWKKSFTQRWHILFKHNPRFDLIFRKSPGLRSIIGYQGLHYNIPITYHCQILENSILTNLEMLSMSTLAGGPNLYRVCSFTSEVSNHTITGVWLNAVPILVRDLRYH